MLVLAARAARARRVAADRRLDHLAVGVAPASPAAGSAAAAGATGSRRSPASMSARVVVARERIDMLGDEVGQLRQRRGSSSWTWARISVARHVLADRDQHPLEQRERLLLIFVDRLLLGVGAQVDDLAQRVERREMLLPVMVERLEQDLLLDLDPALRLDARRSCRPSPRRPAPGGARRSSPARPLPPCSQSSIGGCEAEHRVDAAP